MLLSSHLEVLTHSPNYCFWNITGSIVTGGKIRHVATLASSHQVMGLTTARVIFVRGSFRPWPLVPSTSSSITRCICAGFDSMSKRHTIDTCTRSVRIVCREKTCSRQSPPRLSSRSLTTWFRLSFSPRLYGCRVLDRPIWTFLRLRPSGGHYRRPHKT